MTAKYYAILTNQGAASLANATALGTTLNLTHMAVGDANGTLPSPDPTQTRLINQKRIAPLNMLSIDPNNASQIIAEQVIPETEGGFWIREIGLFDENGVLMAVANCPETYKPQMQEGSGRTQTIRMVLIVSSTAAVTLKIDPSVVLATRKYVDDKAIEVKAWADDQLKKHLAAANPHTQYALLASPTFTGTPSAPDTHTGNYGQQIANTKFVRDLINSTVLNVGSVLPVGAPIPWPSATPPTGWLKVNGAAFDKTAWPLLAAAYPCGKLPDLRGEFIRGWDDARGVDSARTLLSWQKGTINVNDPSFGSVNVASPIHTNNDVTTAKEDFGLDGIVKSDYSNVMNASFTTTNAAIDLDANGFGGGYGSTRPRNVAFNFIVRAA